MAKERAVVLKGGTEKGSSIPGGNFTVDIAGRQSKKRS